MTGRKFAAEDAAPKLARERRMQPPVEVTLQKTRILQPAMIVQARPPCAVTLFPGHLPRRAVASGAGTGRLSRSEERRSELQSLMRISYAVFCLKHKTLMTNQNKQENIAKDDRETIMNLTE